MVQENWLERQMRELEKDPRERAIREMFASIVEVKAPIVVLPVGEVPEFADDAVSRGLVVKNVRQGQMGSTEQLPIRTDNASDCNIFLLKIPQKDGHNKYTMVHVWAGDLDLNLPGAKRRDIAALANQESVAIGITGGRSASIVPTAREFKYEGITTVKHIAIPTGNRYVSAVFRPATNDILVRIGSDEDATEAWVYNGFE